MHYNAFAAERFRKEQLNGNNKHVLTSRFLKSKKLVASQQRDLRKQIGGTLCFSFRSQFAQQPFCNKDRGRAAELGSLAAAGSLNSHQTLMRHAVSAFDQAAKKYGIELAPNSNVSFHCA
jgi:hypothetical protein